MHTDIRRTLLFLVAEDRILLAMKKRGFGQGKYNGIGGKLEPGEGIEDALVRECQEEIKVTPTSWKKVAELDFINDAHTEPWHMYVHAFTADRWQGEPAETEEMAPQWFHTAAIPYDAMWDDDRYWLPAVLNGERVKGRFTFDENDRMLDHTIMTVQEF